MIEFSKVGLGKAGTATLANIAIRREFTNRDNIHIIIGDRGEGKSCYGLKEIYDYLRIKKEMGLIDKITWKRYFKDYFALTTTDANEKYKSMGDEPDKFMFWDEGENIAYSADGVTKRVKLLVKTLAKARKKKIFTVVCLPYYEMLKKEVLKMAHTVSVIPYRVDFKYAYSFVYVKIGNVMKKGDGFGFDEAQKWMGKNLKNDSVKSSRQVKYKGGVFTEKYPKFVFRKLRMIPSYTMEFRWKNIPAKLEAMYNREVKDKLMVAEDENDFVSLAKFNKLNYRYNALMHNLFIKDGKTLAQLERLHIDKFGNRLSGRDGIRRLLDSIECASEVSEDQEIPND
jgi:hypothetical protein